MGKKGHLTFEKRALNIQRGYVRTPRTPPDTPLETINYFKSTYAKNKDLKSKLRDLKDKSRSIKNHLRYDDIAESENESWSDIQENLTAFFYQRLNIQRVQKERGHRIGKPKHYCSKNNSQEIQQS